MIERRHQRSLDEGFSMLAANVRREVSDLEEACRAILDEVLGEEPPGDDVALLIMRTAA